jgi:hypothetical protein
VLLETDRIAARIKELAEAIERDYPADEHIHLVGVLKGAFVFIADLARHMTFLPGDILLTGTPANSRPLEVGDTIDVEVTGVGRLSNKVVEIPAPRSKDGFPASPDSDGVRRVALGNEERLPDKFKAS